MKLPRLYAHRLGREYGPDSSAAALVRPIDGLETDVVLTADGDLALLHDPLLSLGTTLGGWAHERSAEEIRSARLLDTFGREIGERPLLLDELLEAVPRELILQLEIKAHADSELAEGTGEDARRSPRRGGQSEGRGAQLPRRGLRHRRRPRAARPPRPLGRLRARGARRLGGRARPDRVHRRALSCSPSG